MHMHTTLLPPYAQHVVDVLCTQGVVWQSTATGEPIFELYSLLDALQPHDQSLATQLQRVHMIPRRLAALDTYLLYVSLSDVCTHLLSLSTLTAFKALAEKVCTDVRDQCSIFR